MIYTALLHYRIRCKARFDLTIYSKIPVIYWAIPYIMISLAMTDKGTTILLQHFPNKLFKFSHLIPNNVSQP
ncbi:hypothetical protein SAMN02910456_00140 [Ruminococcaceae bacterium YRB3002]|nr:hypothetical protein SAMN02910456_00140 [Ruminococcaceae bacterium YRB3002]